MRIGVDATCWANGRGYGRFARELLPEMVALAPDDEFVCFADERAADRFELRADNVRLERVAQGVSPTLAAAADGNRSPRDMLRLSRAVHRADCDVFFSPSVYSYFPLPLGTRAVVTVHDTIAERFPEMTLPSPKARLFWKLKVALALRQADLVLTVSDYSAREIEQVLGVPRARIRVAGEAPAASYTPSARSDVVAAASRRGLPAGARWFAYVGGFNPHKHVDLIVRAHAALVNELGPDAPHLLLVGAVSDDVFHGSEGRIRSAIAEGGASALVRWAGFIPDDELRHLLTGARALLLPSECEGFGLPAVEAAACGTPVIATKESPLPTLLEGGGIFVAPRDERALLDAMRTLGTDDLARARMGTAARERAQALTWAAGARVALDALHEASA